MTERTEPEDIWDELLIQTSVQDTKHDARLGGVSRSGHDASEGTSKPRPPPLPGSSGQQDERRPHLLEETAALITQDVDDFFNEMLRSSHVDAQKPPLPVVSATRKKADRKLKQQHARHQLLLWLLEIEALEGMHHIELVSRDASQPYEALVVDGKLCALMKRQNQPLLDTQFKMDHEALATRIMSALAPHEDQQESAAWEELLLPEEFALTSQEKRALIELTLRLLTLSATQPPLTFTPLASSPVSLASSIVPLSIRPIDFFNTVDEQLQEAMLGLPSHCIHLLAEAHGAPGWLMHHTRELHPFDTLIRPTRHTPRALHSGARATLLGNTAFQFIEALGMDPSHTCMCIRTSTQCSLVFIDKDLISAHSYPLEKFAGILGEVSHIMSTCPSPESRTLPSPAPSHPHELFHQDDERLKLLTWEVPGCEAVILYELDSAEQDPVWQGRLSDEHGQVARSLVLHEQSIQAMRAALAQLAPLTSNDETIQELYLFDKDHVCLVMPCDALPHHGVVWLCRLDSNLGLVRAQAIQNLSQMV